VQRVLPRTVLELVFFCDKPRGDDPGLVVRLLRALSGVRGDRGVMRALLGERGLLDAKGLLVYFGVPLGYTTSDGLGT